MNFYETVQTMTALGAIAMIMIGSAWLKEFLKEFAAR